jgi:GTPase
MPFRDVIEIIAQGGRGGDGAMSFLRLKYIPKGGPDGGHGGHGGTVWLEAVDALNSLDALGHRRTYKAPSGNPGEGREKAGLAGGDLTLSVPVGTLVFDMDTLEQIGDLVEVGERLQVAAGGQGGRGNASFASSRRQAPRFSESGSRGEQRRLRLELRTIGDVGLVGYPNAGKSSLLAAVSNARPRVADYPFTTLHPQLGVVEREGERGAERLTMADIPGIIEDAHKGRGLGLDFLRHIARTRLLVFVLDVSDDPVATLDALRVELQAYDADLLERPALVALNKIDLADAEELGTAEKELTGFGMPVVRVSATTGAGLDDLVPALFALLPPRPEPIRAPAEPRRVVVDPVRVERDTDGGWVVRGRELEAVVERFDAGNRDAVAYLQHHFASLGVNKLLKRAGAETGDDVRIGAAEFEYFDEDAGDDAREHIRTDAADQRAAERRYRAQQRRAEEAGDDEDDLTVVADDAGGEAVEEGLAGDDAERPEDR